MTTPRYSFDAKEHCHRLDGKPLIGTTAVLNVLAKPLTWYAAGKAVEVFGCPDPKLLTKLKNGKATVEERETLIRSAEAFLPILRDLDSYGLIKLQGEAYRGHSTHLDKAAKGGIDLHTEVARYVEERIGGLHPSRVGFDDQIHAFIEWESKHVKAWLWSEKHCYSEKHWLGGISDAGFEDVNGKYAIIDFKSSKDAYLTQLWQCSAYALQIEEKGCYTHDGKLYLPEGHAFDYVAVWPFGKPGCKEPAVNVDVPGCQRNFLHTLEIYKALPKD